MEKSLGKLVSILYRKNQVYLDLALKPLNITASELPFIMCLFRRDKVSQEQLSADLSIDKAATAKAIMSLEAKGYVRKEKNPSDRRANMIFITPQALACQKQLTMQLEKWTDTLTRDIDEDSVQTMFGVLEQMVKKLEGLDFRKMAGDK